MSQTPPEPHLTLEDRLKAIAYQFVALYERWSEDRQLAAKQGADTAELVQLLRQQVDAFGQLEPAVRARVAQSIHQAASESIQSVREGVEQQTREAVSQSAERLTVSIQAAERTLMTYQQVTRHHHWQVIGVAVASTITTSLLLVWLLVPRPTLPLSAEQVSALQIGTLVEKVWPDLSKKEQQRWLKTLKAKAAAAPVNE
jgi:ElaB/YqjD/DUF883 family membrane-anchored ribosome-binding protein